MLNAVELEELSLHFYLVCTPVLVREIIADLRKDASSGRLPEEVVRTIAAKMCTAHGIQPANFRKLAIGNLCGASVPMIGQVPVDPSAPNVHVSADGKGLLYDSVPEQNMWELWAGGDFSSEDRDVANSWREGLEKVDLRAIGKNWKQFANLRFGGTRNLRELVDRVDGMLADPKPDVQLELMGITLSFLRAPDTVKNIAFRVLLDRPGVLLTQLAPFAASVSRLYLTFVGGLARGFIGPRASHYVDLQYLFYAPFCMAFASADKFHREMWCATSGVNTFVWGQDLKDDLARRAQLRKDMTEEQRKERSEAYGFYPIELEGSPVNELWKTYMSPREEILSWERSDTLNGSRPETLKMIERLLNQFDLNE